MDFTASPGLAWTSGLLLACQGLSWILLACMNFQASPRLTWTVQDSLDLPWTFRDSPSMTWRGNAWTLRDSLGIDFQASPRLPWTFKASPVLAMRSSSAEQSQHSVRRSLIDAMKKINGNIIKNKNQETNTTR